MTLRVFLCQSILIMPEKLILFGKPPCETILYDRRCLNNYHYAGELRSPFIPMYDTHAKQHCMTRCTNSSTVPPMRNNIMYDIWDRPYEFMILLIGDTPCPLHPVWVYDNHTLIVYYIWVIYMYL